MVKEGLHVKWFISTEGQVAHAIQFFFAINIFHSKLHNFIDGITYLLLILSQNNYPHKEPFRYLILSKYTSTSHKNT